MTSPLPLFGLEDFHVKTSQWLGWVHEADFEATNLASSTSLRDLLRRLAPRLLSSKTLQVSSLPTKDEISQSSFGRWSTSGMAWRGESALRRPPEPHKSLHCRIYWRARQCRSGTF